MKKNVKLVICDIDGTLVKTEHVLTNVTKQAIEAIHKQGIYFGIASGRPLDEVSKKGKMWGIDFDFDILIGMNGSELWDGIHGKEYSYYKMKREWLKETIELMAQFPSNFFIYKDGGIFCKKVDKKMIESAKSSDKYVKEVEDISAMYEDENAKIMFRVSEEDMPKIESYLDAHPSPHYKGFKTQSTLMEFADRRTSKAYALQQFCKLNQIALEDVIGFGDTTNDNEFLKCSGLGVCMVNGSDDTKAIADVITDKSNDEDGFADYVMKHIL